MVALVVSAYAAWLLALLIAPAEARELLGKEGLAEHVSHAILVVALVGWSAGATRLRAHRLSRSVVASWCALLLLEETDWGAIYGGPSVLESWVGASNMHNAVAGSTYVLFAIPLLWLYGPVARTGKSALSIPRDHAWAVGIIVVVSLVSPLLGAIEPFLDELDELLLYVVLAASAWASGLSADT